MSLHKIIYKSKLFYSNIYIREKILKKFFLIFRKVLLDVNLIYWKYSKGCKKKILRTFSFFCKFSYFCKIFWNFFETFAILFEIASSNQRRPHKSRTRWLPGAVPFGYRLLHPTLPIKVSTDFNESRLS